MNREFIIALLFILMKIIYSDSISYLVKKKCSNGAEEVYGLRDGCIVLDGPFNHNFVDCSGEFPILKNVEKTGCLTEFDYEDEILNYACPDDEYTYYCAKDIEIEPNTCMESIDLSDGTPILRYKIKMGECFGEAYLRILSDGNDVYVMSYYNGEECDNLSATRILKNGVPEAADLYSYAVTCNIKTSIGKYKSEIHYNNNGFIEYITGTNSFECFGSMSNVCYDNQLIKFIDYSDDECKIDPSFSHFTLMDECDYNGICEYCSRNLPIIDQSIVAHYYYSKDDCLNDRFVSFSVYTPMINSCEKDEVIYLRHENKTNFNLEEYSLQSCDVFETKSLQYGYCYHIQSIQIYIKARINFIINKPEEIHCVNICTLKSTIMINETIYVNVPLYLGGESNVILSLDNFDALFEVGENGKIFIEEGTITLDVESEEKFELLMNNIKSNSSYEIIIIEGSFEGYFKNVNFQAPDTIDNCEMIIGSMKEYNERLSMVFSIDDSGCSKGVKWWVILLICEGVVFLVLIIGIILTYTVKPIRDYVLPFKGTNI